MCSSHSASSPRIRFLDCHGYRFAILGPACRYHGVEILFIGGHHGVHQLVGELTALHPSTGLPVPNYLLIGAANHHQEV